MMRLHTKVLKEAHLAVQNYLGELNNTWIIITTPLSEGADSDDDDSRREQYRQFADWNKCEDNNYFSEGYTSSENSAIPNDAEEEEDIPGLLRENVNAAGKDMVVAWVTSIVLTYMKERLHTKPPTIRKMVLKKKKVQISYWTALRARHMCLEKIHGLGSYERSFRLVPELCHQIKAINPSNIAVWTITFFSDHEKVIDVAVTENFEGIQHNQRSCFRHIDHRMIQKFPALMKWHGNYQKPTI
ncbi:hypothetical protein C5167_014746 [Papaver somniferum]|uniref:Uncharacterized protein n=1 Tax=Papaver somniferum TaxID=3469 RepID=A0A4Y7J440_PAPSO|nr:hypothetical protein C5167_014746 [Papaver somniferum]